MVNDVSPAATTPTCSAWSPRPGVPLVLMHMLGTPATMQDDPHYDDVVAEVEAFLAERCLAAEFAGVDHEALVIDPGIGFGKRDQDNYALLDGLARFTRLGHPVLVGTSRKAFIGRALTARPTSGSRARRPRWCGRWSGGPGSSASTTSPPWSESVRMTEAMLRWGAT